ncbi:MAG: hypothetical protein IJ527_01470 [Prevotella sp.]|nr:hypothetical protein [Prevotella sp.]
MEKKTKWIVGGLAGCAVLLVIGLIVLIIGGVGLFAYLSPKSSDSFNESLETSVTEEVDETVDNATDRISRGLDEADARQQGADQSEQVEVEAPVGMVYKGSIGDYPITMTLALSDVAEGEIAGTYFYNSRPNSIFTLRMEHFETVNTHGTMNLVLYEFTPKGNHTGTFDGHLEGRGGTYTGRFTNSKGEVFDFFLMEQ